MKTLLWQRHFFFEILKRFIFFLSCFFILYIIVDYSIHAHQFAKIQGFASINLVWYYLFLFIKRADLLFPFSLLISVASVMLSANTHKEILALQVGGVSHFKLVLPCFLMAFICTLTIFSLYQWTLPQSLTFLDRFEAEYFNQSNTSSYETPSVYCIYGRNEEKVIFGYYDANQKRLNDVYVIPSDFEVLKIKWLDISDTKSPVAHFVDVLAKNQEGEFEKTFSLETQTLSNLTIDLIQNKKTSISYENSSLSKLWRYIFRKSNTYYQQKGKILTHFLYKLVMPLVNFLIILAVTPYCLRYSRRVPSFTVFCLAIFGFVAFFTVMDGSVIIGECNKIPPTIVILFPFVTCLLYFSWNFIYYNYNKN